MTEIPTTSGSGTLPGSEVGADPAAVEADRRVQEVVRTEWRMLLVLGVISILFGLGMIVWQDATLRVVAVLVGIWLLGAGIVRVLSAFMAGQSAGRQILSGIVGLLLIVGGVACLRDLAKGLAVLAFLIALTWLFSGLSAIMLAFGERGGQRIGLFVIGALSLLVGLVFLVVPELSLTALIWLTGLSAIAIGAGECVMAFRLRRQPVAIVAIAA
jgi:uncharacterized membrane protein HdeD (DUF308 family)